MAHKSRDTATFFYELSIREVIFDDVLFSAIKERHGEYGDKLAELIRVILNLLRAPRGRVIVSKLVLLERLRLGSIRFSLGVSFFRPCATSKEHLENHYIKSAGRHLKSVLWLDARLAKIITSEL